MKPTLRLGACACDIAASASAFPPDAVATPELLARLTPDLPSARRDALLAHLERELGVVSRAHLAPGADPIDLAVAAARDAIAASVVPASAFSALLVATSTASRWTTAESARIADRLRLAVAFCDLRSGCTGGLWALVEGARLARDGQAPVLVIGVDSFSRAFPANERLLPLAMGDGATALVLTPRPDNDDRDDGEDTAPGLVRAVFGGAPDLVDLATVTARLPPVAGDAFTLEGDPERFASAAESALVAAIDALAPPPDAILAPHVSRLATARRLAERAGLPLFADGFVAHGNLGAAALLTALHLLRMTGSPTRQLRATADAPQHVALASAGGGLSYGAALWRLPRTP